MKERKNIYILSAGQKPTQNVAMEARKSYSFEEEGAGPGSLRLARSSTFLWRNSSEEDETTH